MLPCAIVLAGGKSSRFGSDKALYKVDGFSLTALCVTNLLTVFDNVYVVSKQIESLEIKPDNRVKLIKDSLPVHAALIGMMEGLRNSDYEMNYITGCDMPAVVPELITALHDLAQDKDCALRADAEGMVQPLGAFYSRKSLPVIENMVKIKRYKLNELIASLDSAIMPFEQVKLLDPNLLSFQNINTPDDLAQLTW